jgi:hypothetical protein
MEQLLLLGVQPAALLAALLEEGAALATPVCVSAAACSCGSAPRHR